MKIKPRLDLPDFDTEGFIFEVSANLDCPDSPLVDLNIRNLDKTYCFSLSVSNQGLDLILDLLLDSSRGINTAYEKYWNEREKK